MWYRGCSLMRTVCFGSALIMLSTVATVVTAEQQPKIRVVPVIGHVNHIYSVAFSPDGACVLSGSEDRTSNCGRRPRGLLRTFTGHSGGGPLRFTRRCPRALRQRGHAPSSCGTRPRGCYTPSRGHPGRVCRAFSPDGTRVLSGSEDRSLKLWEAATGQLIRTFTGHATCSIGQGPQGRFHPTTRVLSGSKDPPSNCGRKRRARGVFTQMAPACSRAARTTPSNCGRRPRGSSSAPSRGMRVGSPRWRFHPTVPACSRGTLTGR